MYFVSVDELLGGSVLGAASLTLPGYADPQRMLMPAAGATVYVYLRGGTTQADCFADQHGAGAPAVQPFSTDADGHVVDGAGNRLFTAQPVELDVAVSGGRLTSPQTIPVGGAGEGGAVVPRVQGAMATGLGASQTVDFAGTVQEIWLVGTLNANLTVTVLNRVAGCRLRLQLLQDATGGRTLTVSDGVTPQAVSIGSAAGAYSEVLVDCPDAANVNVAEVGGGTVASGVELTSRKDQPSGYAGLDGSGKLQASELPISVVSASSPTNRQGVVWNAASGTWQSAATGTNLGNGTAGDFATYANVRNVEVDYIFGPGGFGTSAPILGPFVQGRGLLVKYFAPCANDSQQADSTGVFLVDPGTSQQPYTAMATVGNESDAVPQGWVCRGFPARVIAHIAKAQGQVGTGSITGLNAVIDYLYGYYAANQSAISTGTLIRQMSQFYAQDPTSAGLGTIGAYWSYYAENSIHTQQAYTIANYTGIEGSLNASVSSGVTTITLEQSQGATAAQSAVTGTTTTNSTTITGLSSTAYPVAVGAFVSGLGLPLGTTILSVNAGASSCVVSIPAGVYDSSTGSPGTGTLQIGGGLKGGNLGASGTLQLDVGINAEQVTFSAVSNDTVTISTTKKAHARYARVAVLDANGFGNLYMSGNVITSDVTIKAAQIQGVSGVFSLATSGVGFRCAYQTSAPATPPAGQLYWYPNANGRPSYKGPDGTEKGALFGARHGSATSASMTALDDILASTNRAAAMTWTLLQASTQQVGQRLTIKDESGQAASFNITITPFAGDTIDGASSLVMSTNFQAVRLYCTGSGWAVI